MGGKSADTVEASRWGHEKPGKQLVPRDRTSRALLGNPCLHAPHPRVHGDVLHALIVEHALMHVPMGPACVKIPSVHPVARVVAVLDHLGGLGLRANDHGEGVRGTGSGNCRRNRSRRRRVDHRRDVASCGSVCISAQLRVWPRPSRRGAGFVPRARAMELTASTHMGALGVGVDAVHMVGTTVWHREQIESEGSRSRTSDRRGNQNLF